MLVLDHLTRHILLLTYLLTISDQSLSRPSHISSLLFITISSFIYFNHLIYPLLPTIPFSPLILFTLYLLSSIFPSPFILFAAYGEAGETLSYRLP